MQLCTARLASQTLATIGLLIDCDSVGVRRGGPRPPDGSEGAASTLHSAPFDVSAANIDALGAAEPREHGPDGGALERSERGASVRGVDWCNLGYPPPLPTLSRCRGSFDERHRAGEGIHSVDRYRLTAVAYGDMTGDGREDALLVMSGEIHPVLIHRGPLTPVGWLVLAQMRGREAMVLDAVATGTVPVVRVGVRGSAARVVRRWAGMDCIERWSWSAGRLRGDPTGGLCGAASVR